MSFASTRNANRFAPDQKLYPLDSVRLLRELREADIENQKLAAQIDVLTAALEALTTRVDTLEGA